MSVKKQCNHNVILFGIDNYTSNVPDENVIVIASKQELEEVLEDICLEIDKRFRLFAKYKITNIDELNVFEKRPYYTIIIDESIDNSEIKDSLNYILNLGRSTGFFSYLKRK